MANQCPQCHRSATWSNRWQSCTACDQAKLPIAEPLFQYPVYVYGTADPQMIDTLRNVPSVTEVSPVTKGRPRVHQTNADRQRAYRQRKSSNA